MLGLNLNHISKSGYWGVAIVTYAETKIGQTVNELASFVEH